MGDSLAAALQLQVVPVLVPLEVRIKHLQALALLPQADCLDNRIKIRSEHKAQPACSEDQEAVLEGLALVAQVEALLAHQHQQGLAQILNHKIKERLARPFQHILKKILLLIRMSTIKASLFSSRTRIFHSRS